jgi:hypothetical protein
MEKKDQEQEGMGGGHARNQVSERFHHPARHTKDHSRGQRSKVAGGVEKVGRGGKGKGPPLNGPFHVLMFIMLNYIALHCIVQDLPSHKPSTMILRRFPPPRCYYEVYLCTRLNVPRRSWPSQRLKKRVWEVYGAERKGKEGGSIGPPPLRAVCAKDVITFSSLFSSQHHST